MIFDKLDNLSTYLPDSLNNRIAECLKNIDSNTEDKTFYIDGENLFLRVMSYRTSLRQDCAIEAHNKYIDIQSTLVGVEGIDIFDRNSLDEKTAYSEKNDVAFYQQNEKAKLCDVSVYPGYFALIFPHEAHKPQVAVNNLPQEIKKFVIKIRVDYYEKL